MIEKECKHESRRKLCNLRDYSYCNKCNELLNMKPTENLTNQKPVFIPLNKEYFEQFEKGTKTIEYRKFGTRWNLRNCTPCRAVTLSCGYGKQRRLNGVIKSFKTTKPENCKAKEDFYKIYGADYLGLVAEIEITLTNLKIEL